MHQSTNMILHKMVALWLLLSISIVLSLSAAPLKIMMLGDSITEGGGGIPDTPEENQSTYTKGLIQKPDHIGYRAKLFDLLVADGYSIGGPNDDLDFVGSRSGGINYLTAFDMDHQAVSGYTSQQILDNIDGWLLTTPADIFLLHVGTNDGAKKVPIGSDDDPDEDSNTTVNNVRKIINSIFTANANAKVFVARIIEARRAEALSPWRTNTLNNKIEEMINNHSQSANIKMVNMQNGAEIIYNPCGTTLGDMQPFHIDENGGISYDYHPNHKGYEKMAQKWHDELMASGWLEPIAPVTSSDHFWTLESGSPYIDSNGSSHATCTGTACPETVAGKVGNALYFENNGTHKEVLVANVDAYDVNESYTVEFWMNPEGNTTADNEVVVRHGSLWIGRNNNTLRYDLQGDGGYNANAGTLSENWNHIVLSYNGTSGEAKAYINGLVTSTSTIIPTPLTDTFFYIGHYYSTQVASTNYGYNGAVDEVAVYRRVLTAAEVSAHYAAGGEVDNNDTNTTDTTAPVITLLGANPQRIIVGGTYVDPGYTANDDTDGNITANVVVGGDTVDTSTEGNYTITYDVNDTAGNNATQVTRIVIVNATDIGENPDQNGNGIPDAQEKDWFIYESTIKTLTVTPTTAAQSILRAIGIDVAPSVIGNEITLKDTESNAYVRANEQGQVETGFGIDSTLKKGTFFKPGSSAVIKKIVNTLLIETTTNQNKDDFFIIGGD